MGAKLKKSLTSMRLKATLIIMLTVITITAANYLSSLSFTRQAVAVTMKNELAMALDIAENLIITRIKLLKADAVSIAKSVVQADSIEAMMDILRTQESEFHEFTSLTVYDRNGFVMNYGEPIPHDSHFGKNDFVQKTLEGESLICPPHYSELDGSFIMHIFVPMENDMVLSATFPGLYFADILSEYRLWQNGSLFMVDETGTIVANFRTNLVYEQHNFIEEAKNDPSMKRTADFFKKMISSKEPDSGSYMFMGEERFCIYKHIGESDLGWYIGVAAPLGENPANRIQEGLLSASLLFLGLGFIASFIISWFAVKPFEKIKEQNTDIEAKNKELEKLYETVNAQAARLEDEYERTKVLLDATPLACRLMKKTNSGMFELFECNKKATQLFDFKNKQEYIERYFETYPEYQPDGKNSIEEAWRLFNKAYAEGSCVVKFSFQMPDGTPVPAEVTLIRVKFGGEDVIAGYTRDLREQERMLCDIEKRDHLLNVINRVAAALLSPTVEQRFEESLLDSMEFIGKHLEADCVQIWSNKVINDILHFALKHKWLSETGLKASPVDTGTATPYIERWKELFLRGECINGPIAELPQEEYNLLNSFGIVSTIAIPLFHQGNFWGIFSLNDCVKERYYTESEVDILRSAGLMLVNAMIRGAQVAEIREAHDRAELFLDAMPLSGCLINRNINIFRCNEGTVRLFGLDNRQEFIDNFYNYSPRYQPDGQLSAEAAARYITRAFEDGTCSFEWMHQKKDGTPLPTETALVRIAYDNDYVVAGYVRDLREQKRMMAEIERNSKLLSTVNQMANILLQSENDRFENDLQQCMNMIGKAVNADRVCIWKNKTIDGKLFCDLVYDWPGGQEFAMNRDAAVNVSYDENIPGWKEILSNGKCINTSISLMSPEEQLQLKSHGVKSLFVAPVFLNNEFWGYVGFDDLHNEKTLSDNEVSTLYSGSLLIASALIRNEMLLNLKSANNSKSDFLAKMSHEMRTPLNAVIGLTALALEDETVSEETRLNIEKVSSAGELLLSTVNDILDISKIEAGRFELVPVKYDIPSLLNDTVTQSIMYIGEKPIKFVLDIDEKLPTYLYGDDLRIKQLFNNLLSNAFKFTREGAVELGVRCERESEETVCMTVWVKDTGIGIKPEEISTLFDEFYQADTQINRHITGTGLGLPITKKMVELMGGSIAVESEYGKGSKFTIMLKQKFVTDEQIGREVVSNLRSFRYSDHKRRSNSKKVRPKLPNACVLVVDDNITNLDVARGIMKPYNMKQIDCVTSGQQAIDAIRECKVRYNAIFMDHMMPEMDGIEAIGHIRAIGTDYAKNIPIIACTANAISGSEQMFLSKGFQAFISKPIDSARLDDIIRRWVRDKDQGKQPAVEESVPDTDSGNKSLRTALLNAAISRLDIAGSVKRFGGDEEVYFKVLRSYADNIGSMLDKIKTVDKDKLADYAIVAHGIKGSSRSIGAISIGNMADDLEKAANKGDYDFVDKHNASFIENVGSLASDIELLIKKIADENPKPRKGKPDRDILLRFMESFNLYDMDGVDKAIKEIDEYEYEACSGLAAWLRENVDQLNFDLIKQKLESLIDA